MTSYEISALKKKIEGGDLNSVIDELIQFSLDKDNDLHNELIVLKSKYTKANRSYNIGVIDFDSLQRIVSQISYVLLDDYLGRVKDITIVYAEPQKRRLVDELSRLQILLDNVKDELGFENLQNELINEKSLKHYLTQAFPNLPYETDKDHFDVVFSGLDLNKYKYIRDINLIFKLTGNILESYEGEHNSCLGRLALAIGCVDLKYRSELKFWTPSAIEIFEEFSNGYKLKSICSFCGADKHSAKLLIKGKTGFICESCTQQAYDLKLEEGL